MRKTTLTQPRTITGRAGATPNRISWTPLEGQFPMHHAVHGNRLGGAVALAVGVPWLLYSGPFLFEEIGRRGLEAGQALPILLVLGGLVVALFGVSQFVYREETAIDGETVHWTRRGASGSKGWREPVSRYQGVLKHRESWSSHDLPGPSYVEYLLTLSHDDPSRRVRLFESRSSPSSPPDEWGRMWTHYAELFRLPALEDDRHEIPRPRQPASSRENA